MHWRWLQRVLQRLQRHRRGGADVLIPDHELVPELSRRRDTGGGQIMDKKKPMDQVVFEGPRVILNTLDGGPGGHAEFQGETSVEDFTAEWFRRCRAQGAISYGLAPPGIVVRTIWHRNGIVVFLIEVTPGPRTMQWLRDDSPAAFGPSATYRDVYVSLPWQYFFIAMYASGQLAGGSSVYFLNAQLRGTNQELADCHFFNCSVNVYQLHCWICSQYFPERKNDQSLAEYAASIITRFYSGGFNQSSEHHEGASFWGRNRTLIKDPRVQTIDAWEAVTRSDPHFALTVPWLSSGLTTQRVFEQLTRNNPTWFPRSTKDVANVVTACIDRWKGG